MNLTLEEHAEELRTRGYTIVESVLDADQLAETNAALDQIFETEYELGLDRGWRNEVYQVAYMLPQKHPLFRSFPLNPKVLPLMQLLLGNRCVLGSLNGLSMTPGGETQRMHLDQTETVPGALLYINALHALDDFTRANGCTRVVPFSQNRPFSRQMDPAEYEGEAVYLEAPAGSLIAYNGGLWHAGSQNTTDKRRRAIHAFFHKPWVRSQWDYPRSLSAEVIAELTPAQKRLFGFYSRTMWYDYRTDSMRKD